MGEYGEVFCGNPLTNDVLCCIMRTGEPRKEDVSAMPTKIVLGDAVIHNGDCLIIFKQLDACSVDFVATDPPYFIDGMGDDWSDNKLKQREAKSGVVRGLPVGMKFDPRQGLRLERFFYRVSAETLRVLKPGGFMVAFSQGRLYHRLAVAAENAGFEVRDLLIWMHGGGQGKAFTQNHFVRKMNISDVEKRIIIQQLRGRKTPQLRPKFEAILLAQKPRQGTFVANWLKWETGLIETSFQSQQTTIFSFGKSDGAHEAVDHMTVKPTNLMARLVEVFTVPGQVVLDPFMGSGSTGIAALQTGRKFIGFEIDEGYFRTSARRLDSCGKTKSAG